MADQEKYVSDQKRQKPKPCELYHIGAEAYEIKLQPTEWL